MTSPSTSPDACLDAAAYDLTTVTMSTEVARDLAEAFFTSAEGAPYRACCEVSQWATGMCVEVSEAFADFLHTHGHRDAATLDLDTTAAHPYIPAGAPHTVVTVGGLVVDLTHRQFDPDADLPVTQPATEFLTGWRIVSWT